MQTITREGGLRFVRVESAPGDLVEVVELSPGALSLTVKPPVGGSVLVEVSCGTLAAVKAGQAVFAPVLGLGTAGSVSETQPIHLPGSHSAVRLTATAPGAIVEVLQ